MADEEGCRGNDSAFKVGRGDPFGVEGGNRVSCACCCFCGAGLGVLLCGEGTPATVCRSVIGGFEGVRAGVETFIVGWDSAGVDAGAGDDLLATVCQGGEGFDLDVSRCSNTSRACCCWSFLRSFCESFGGMSLLVTGASRRGDIFMPAPDG